MPTQIIPEFAQEYAKHLFDYCPDTGLLYWKNCEAAGDKKGSIVGHPHKTLGYRMVYIKPKTLYVHRIVWLFNYGFWPKNQIDHINGDKLDNRLINLRDVSSLKNKQNTRMYINNKSGIMGVNWSRFENKWKPYIGNKKREYLGTYEDFFEACCARKSAELRHGYHSNHGRID